MHVALMLLVTTECAWVPAPGVPTLPLRLNEAYSGNTAMETTCVMDELGRQQLTAAAAVAHSQGRRQGQGCAASSARHVLMSLTFTR